MRSTCILYSAMLVAALAQTVGGEEVARVGAYGDPSLLAIEGAQSYDAAEIVRALANDLDVAFASCSDRPLAELKAVLADKLRQGYLSDGFADVRVTVGQDAARLVLTVEEGQRFKAGEVRIVGAASIDTEAVVVELTAPSSDRKLKKAGARWPTGDDAPFGDVRREALQNRVHTLLQDQGFYDAQFIISLEADPKREVADLQVKITSEGAPLTAADLEIVGNERNSRTAILDYLDLRSDSVLTGEVRARIADDLNDSGRFSKVRLHAPSDEAGGKPRLELSEYKQAPALIQPLSREEAALINFYHWAQRFDDGADEFALQLHLDDIRGGLISAPPIGIVAWIGGLAGAKPPANDAAPVQPDLALVATDAEIGVYSYRRGRQLMAIPTPAQVIVQLDAIIANGPPKLNGSGEFKFSAGLKKSAKRMKRHCEFRFKQTAVGALSLAHQEDSRFRWQGDHLTIEWSDQQVVIDEQTGRLLDYGEIAEDGEPQPLRMYFARDEFAAMHRQLQQAADGFENDASSDRPVSCVAAYACDEWEYWSTAAKISQLVDLARVLGKIVDRGLLHPLDELFVEPKRPDDKFAIPMPYFDVSSTNSLSAIADVAARAWGVEIGNRLAPRDSWPWALSREAAFVATGKGEIGAALDRLKVENAGPIRCLAASLLLDAAGYKAESRLAASEGLKRCELADFRHDYPALLQRGYLAGDSLLGLAVALRELDESEVDSLAAGAAAIGPFDQQGSHFLVEIAEQLRKSPEKPVDDILPAVLDSLWQTGLQDYVQAALKSAAKEPPPPIPAETLERLLKALEPPPPKK